MTIGKARGQLTLQWSEESLPSWVGISLQCRYSERNGNDKRKKHFQVKN